MTEVSKRLPAFEGQAVAGTVIKMSGAIPMDDLDGEVVGIDDIVQLKAQFKCVGVQHQVNSQGEIIRVQVLRPLFMVPDPLDPERPEAGFVMRALPAVVHGTVEKSEDE